MLLARMFARARVLIAFLGDFVYMVQAHHALPFLADFFFATFPQLEPSLTFD
jgi:hypothetical protein